MKIIINESQFNNIIKEQRFKFLRDLLRASKSIAPELRTLKDYDNAINYFKNLNKSFGEEQMVLIKKLKGKEINGQEYVKQLNDLHVKYKMKDSHTFNDYIKELEDIKKSFENKRLIKDIPQQNILKDKNQLTKNISGGGSNNRGVFDLGNGYVAKGSNYGWTNPEIKLLNMKDRIKSPRIMRTVQIKSIPDNAGKDVIYFVQQKAVGTTMDKMSIDQIRRIPKQHIDNFRKDLNELRSIGMTVDPSKMSNFVYDANKGIQLIDLGIGDYLNRVGKIDEVINHVLKIGK